MGDAKPTTNFYDNLGGVNEKASAYAVGRAQFLYLSNLDFDIPNALNKRPGSTQAVSAGTSGPITSLFEFVKLSGDSYVIAGSDTAMFYLAVNTYTLLDTGWNNGQPTDMLTFVDKAWLANGQKMASWRGHSYSVYPWGLPFYRGGVGVTSAVGFTTIGLGATVWSIFGVTHAPLASNNPIVGPFVVTSYVREDGYFGPCIPFFTDSSLNFFGGNNVPAASGNLATFTLYGLTTLSGYGISSIALWIALERALNFDPQLFIPPVTSATMTTGGGGLRANADFDSYFYLYTLLPAGTTLAVVSLSGWSSFINDSLTLIPYDLDSFSFRASNWQIGSTNALTYAEFSLVARYIDINQNTMFYSGFSSAPSAIWFSDLGEPESIQPDSNFEVRTNDGDRIFGHKTYNNQTIVFKENSFHKIIGDSADNFQLVELSQQFGCISNKTIVEFREDLVWLDSKGVVRFNGASWELISTAVEDTFRRMNLSAAKDKAVATHYRSRNQIWFGVPLDNSTENNITIVWDYLVDAWTFFEGFKPSSFAWVKAYNNRPTVWRGDYSGMIYYHGEVFYGDNGQGITCTAKTHWDKGKENETWVQRRLFLDVNTVTGVTGVITGKVFKDYDATTIQATYTMYQNTFQSRAEMGVVGKAFSTEWAHNSASLPLLINGYSWAKRFLRNV